MYIFILTTLVAICACLYGFALSQVKFLKDNWLEYRCNPIYIPMAGMVGKDITTTFTECTMKSFHDYAGFIMDPIMAEFSTVISTVGELGGAVHDMRGMMSSVRGAFIGIIGSVFGKLQNTMSSIQYIIIRMRTLMARILAIMVSIMMMVDTGMKSGESVSNGPIMKIVRALS
jgi:hypothetical protein